MILTSKRKYLEETRQQTFVQIKADWIIVNDLWLMDIFLLKYYSENKSGQKFTNIQSLSSR